MPGNTVLVVEDEAEVRELIAFTLERSGFGVREADSVESAIAQLDDVLPDLIVVDWMLPGATGIEFVRRLRRDVLTADLPLLMLTAKGEETDKLKSFDVGVDDYVTKPFSPKELTARIRALLRRAGSSADGQFVAGDLLLDTQAHQLSIQEKPVHIGPTEFRLLEFLLRHPERVFDRSQLLDRVWGRSAYVEERTVDVHVLRLRKILAPHGLAHRIQTVRGIGYRFTNA